VEAAALADLHVQPGALLVEELDAVHAQVGRPAAGGSVRTSGNVMKRPPSRGQVWSAGRRERRGGLSTTSVTGPALRRASPTRARRPSSSR
jgi:hypothetical protein